MPANGRRDRGLRVAAVDEANLVLDAPGQVNVFLVAARLSPGGFVGPDGVPDMEGLRAALTARIGELPPLRRVAVPLGRRHHWVEVVPDLTHHIRGSEPVSGLSGLELMCAGLMSVLLPRNRPLWELLIIPDTAGVEPWVVMRVHHAIADGVAAVGIVQHLFDNDAATGEAAPIHEVPFRPRHRNLTGIIRNLPESVRRIAFTLTTRDIGTTRLLGVRSDNRGVTFVDADLAALRASVRPLGATVNDALLAAVASGYQALLPVLGERVPAVLPISVPVALPRRGTSGNQVGVMRVRLPLGEPDAEVRLRLIAEQTRLEKAQARLQGTLEFMRGPVGARLMNRVAAHQRLVAGFVTNVPGPAGRFRLAGAPVAALWPVGVLAGNVRLGVAALSYGGRLNCSVHFDADALPGSVFSEAFARELTRLSS